jgi:hypothetical protein
MLAQAAKRSAKTWLLVTTVAAVLGLSALFLLTASTQGSQRRPRMRQSRPWCSPTVPGPTHPAGAR